MDRDDTDPRVIIFTLWLVVFSIASQAIIIAPIIPTMACQLSVDEATLGTLITSYAVMVGVFSLVAGPDARRAVRPLSRGRPGRRPGRRSTPDRADAGHYG